MSESEYTHHAISIATQMSSFDAESCLFVPSIWSHRPQGPWERSWLGYPHGWSLPTTIHTIDLAIARRTIALTMATIEAQAEAARRGLRLASLEWVNPDTGATCAPWEASGADAAHLIPVLDHNIHAGVAGVSQRWLRETMALRSETMALQPVWRCAATSAALTGMAAAIYQRTRAGRVDYVVITFHRNGLEDRRYARGDLLDARAFAAAIGFGNQVEEND